MLIRTDRQFGGLAARGIQLGDPRPGEHRGPCPSCDRGPNDTALAVRVEPDGGATWVCHRCGFRGGLRGERSAVWVPAQTQPSPDKRARAGEIWRTTYPLDGPARAYLEGRHCPLPPPDGDLHWHPDLRLFHRSGPALVGRITLATDQGQDMGLHLTWLAWTEGRWTRTERRYLGKKQGGVIRLWPDEAITAGLAVGEGIETCLSGSRLMTPVWCAMDAGNLAALPVLDGIECLVVFADHDEPGLAAAESVMARWEAAGREVRALVPRGAKDLNEVSELWTQ